MKSSLKETVSNEATTDAPVSSETLPNQENEQRQVPATTEQSAAPAVADSFFSNNEMEGDFERSDFKIPRLNLVQNVGPLSEDFTPGEFIYNRETVLGSNVKLTLLKLRKYFIEDVPYGSDVFPNIVNTIEEVHQLGAFLTKEKRVHGEGHTYYKPALDATVLLEGAPDNDVFPFEFNGTPYAVALWTLQSVAYGRTGTTLITASQLGLRAGLSTGFWNVSAKREKIGTNLIWLPVARQGGRNSEEFVQWAAENIVSNNI